MTSGVTDIEDCELCGEPEDDLESFGHFWDPVAKGNVIAHGQCGEDAGLALA